jgi:hypothetical protein
MVNEIQPPNMPEWLSGHSVCFRIVKYVILCRTSPEVEFTGKLYEQKIKFPRHILVQTCNI